jgi:hypothetical protein
MPLFQERTYPPVPCDVVANLVVPCPYGIAPVWMDAQPVPPEDTGSALVKLAELAESVPVAVMLAALMSPLNVPLPPK